MPPTKKRQGSVGSTKKSRKKIANEEDNTQCTQENLELDNVPITMEMIDEGTHMETPGDSSKEEEKKQKVETEIDDLVSDSIDMPHGGDILDSLTIHKGVTPPRIPLCRCLVNPIVRQLRKDLSVLKRAFETEGYVVTKGSFILSISLPDGTIKEVDDEVKSKWDRNWNLVNEEFESEIQDDPMWGFLSSKMFFVWEGNHRTASWMQSIGEVFVNNKARHIRVHAQIIEPEAKNEMQLIAALQRFNLLNEEAIVVTNLKDYLFHTSTLVTCDSHHFLEGFTEEEKRNIDIIRQKEISQGKRVWYPLTQTILGRMVYSGKWKADYDMACKKLPIAMDKDEREVKINAIKKSVNSTYRRKIHRILCVVNPIHGKEWFDVLWALPFEDATAKVTLDKIYQVSIATCSKPRQLSILALLGADINLKSAYGMPSSDHPFIEWLAREVYMDQVLDAARTLLSQVVTTSVGDTSLQLPEHPTVSEYFQAIVVRHRGDLYEKFTSSMSVANVPSKQIDLINASRRLVYRFLQHLLESKKIGSMPSICKAWTMLIPSTFCMYTSSIFREDKSSQGRISLTVWERKHCPWWLDMKPGTCLEEELLIFERHAKGECASDSLSSANVNEEQRKKLDEEQKQLVEHQRREIGVLDPSRVGRPKTINIDDTCELPSQDEPLTMSKLQNIEYVFAPLSSLPLFRLSLPPRDYVKVWEHDYILLGKEILRSQYGEGFKELRQFFANLNQHNRRRNSQPASWSVDFCVVDLPTNYGKGGQGGNPSWNLLSEDHVTCSLAIAAAVMDDSGWTLVMCSSSCATLVERIAVRMKLEVACRWMAQTMDPISLSDTIGIGIKTCVFQILAMRRIGQRAPVSMQAAMSIASKMKLDLGNYLLPHYMPSSMRCMQEGKAGAWRGNIEKSSSFMLMFVEMFCPLHGSILELGAGTGPCMKAAIHSGRACLAVEVDKDICNLHLKSTLDGWYMDEGASTQTSHMHMDVDEQVFNVDIPLD